MKQILAITRKELSSYFGSPMALIFIGAFLAATLFTFFWIDTFFARGIADVRPLFRWMPLLILFLVSALTMRQWSEEQQTGTLEILLTLPVRAWQLVLGKFLAVMVLVAITLALTLFLPISVSIMGDLDWGPVIGGYLAALLLAAAYTAIGLFISSRTNNQIVALILSVVLCGLFYFIGNRSLTEFFGESVGDVLRLLSTNSRFESIERGVIDLRVLVYYITLAVVFLALNVLSLDSKRWSIGAHTANYRTNANLAVGLLTVNALLLNVWLQPVTALRADLTQSKEYSLSTVTEDLLANLQEPLLIRAYFSERTHPLLAPLVPRIRDMLTEYQVASHGKVMVEVVDPAQNPDLEAEAAQSYGIRPTPFQIAGRYESSVVNAYFDILVRYGDKSEVLNFRDLIEVEPFRDGTLDVRLRNLEYDLTRTIKKVVYGFQSIDAVLAALTDPAVLTLYVTPDTLPEEFATVPDTVQKVATELETQSNGKFSLKIVNPDDPSSGVTRQQLLDQYGLQPFTESFLSTDTYYLHMVLQVGSQGALIYPSGDMTEADIRTSIESSLKRMSSGFLKVVGLWLPQIQPDPQMAQMGQTQQPLFSTWNSLSQQLQQDYEVQNVDLSSGQAPANLDVLVVIAPQNMTDKEKYAIDQYLMRGGALVVAGSNFRAQPDPFSGALAVTPIEGGINELLAHYGVEIGDSLVLDPNNEPFPITVQRQVNGFNVQEIQALDYPYFVDVRGEGMSTESPIIANLPAVTLNWVSPVIVQSASAVTDTAATADATAPEVVALLSSSPESWTSSSTNIQPDMQQFPEYGFPVGDTRGAQPLAVSMRGSFKSFYADKESPLAAAAEENAPGVTADASALDANTGPVPATIGESPNTARLVVIGSGEFLSDTIFDISSQLSQDRFRNSLQLIQNVVDWSVEDQDLLAIRARSSRVRLLNEMSESDQAFWEYLNYGVALAALVIIGLLWASRRRNEKPMQLTPPTSGPGRLEPVEQA